MSELTFEKWEGQGNDFVVVFADTEAAWEPARVMRVCDRRFGVGADGVLLVMPPLAGGAARMRVKNADGSVPEMCGNGLRCVALVVAEREELAKGSLVIETDSGPRECLVERRPDGGEVDVDMGVVKVIDERAVTVDGAAVAVTVVDAGNPHAVVYRDDPRAALSLLGPPLASHAAFENGVNVEIVRWAGKKLEVSVWERGVGPTLACGTGACAVVAVACGRGEVKSGERVTVSLPGGELVVTHDVPSGKTRMSGPARRVFRGEWTASLL